MMSKNFLNRKILFILSFTLLFNFITHCNILEDNIKKINDLKEINNNKYNNIYINDIKLNQEYKKHYLNILLCIKDKKNEDAISSIDNYIINNKIIFNKNIYNNKNNYITNYQVYKFIALSIFIKSLLEYNNNPDKSIEQMYLSISMFRKFEYIDYFELTHSFTNFYIFIREIINNNSTNYLINELIKSNLIQNLFIDTVSIEKRIKAFNKNENVFSDPYFSKFKHNICILLDNYILNSTDFGKNLKLEELSVLKPLEEVLVFHYGENKTESEKFYNKLLEESGLKIKKEKNGNNKHFALYVRYDEKFMNKLIKKYIIDL